MFNWDQYTSIRLLLPFVIGIALAIQMPEIPWKYAGVVLLVCLGALSYLSNKKTKKLLAKRLILGSLVVAIFMSLGLLRADVYRAINDSQHFSHSADKNTVLIARLTEAPQSKANSYKAILEVQEWVGEHKRKKANGQLLAYFSKECPLDLEYGDVIAFANKSKTIDPPKNPNQFDYKQYMQTQNIEHQIYLKEGSWEILQEQPLWLYQQLYGLREHLLERLTNKINSVEETAVASALVLGYKQLLNDDIRAIYSNTGAMHVLAVSGLHVGILFALLNKLLYFMDRSKRLRILQLILVLIAIWFFAFLTGLSPSVCRAALMFSLFQFGKLGGKDANGFNILAASAFILLLWNPFLIVQVGFQLSYLAVASILLVCRPISSLLQFDNKILSNLWDWTALSLSAQIGTLPISLFYFHQFPVLFLVSNMVVMTGALLILPIGLTLLSIGQIEPLGTILGWLLQKAIYSMNFLLSQIEQLPLSVIENIHFGFWAMVLTYLFIGGILLYLFLREVKFLKIALGICVVLMAELTFSSFNFVHQKQLIVYQVKKGTAIDFINGQGSLLLLGNIDQKNTKSLDYILESNHLQSGIQSVQAYQISELNQGKHPKIVNHWPFLHFEGENLLILTQAHRFTDLAYPNKLDLIVLSENSKADLNNLPPNFDQVHIVMDGSNDYHQTMGKSLPRKGVKLLLHQVPGGVGKKTLKHSKKKLHIFLKHFCKNKKTLYICPPERRRSGGTGRRAGFKIQCWQQRVGSSPTFGTKP